jgi:hypothetical protein
MGHTTSRCTGESRLPVVNKLRKQLIDEALHLRPGVLIKHGLMGGVLGRGVEFRLDADLRRAWVRYAADGNVQMLWLETTPCHFGGVRWWIYCSRCNSRRRTLYLPLGHWRFACRDCLRLGYQSQLMQPLQRAELALRKLSARYPPHRPRGRWRRTHWRGRLLRDVAEFKFWRLAGRDVADATSQVGLPSENEAGKGLFAKRISFGDVLNAR